MHVRRELNVIFRDCTSIIPMKMAHRPLDAKTFFFRPLWPVELEHPCPSLAELADLLHKNNLQILYFSTFPGPNGSNCDTQIRGVGEICIHYLMTGSFVMIAFGKKPFWATESYVTVAAAPKSPHSPVLFLEAWAKQKRSASSCFFVLYTPICIVKTVAHAWNYTFYTPALGEIWAGFAQKNLCLYCFFDYAQGLTGPLSATWGNRKFIFRGQWKHH